MGFLDKIRGAIGGLLGGSDVQLEIRGDSTAARIGPDGVSIQTQRGGSAPLTRDQQSLIVFGLIGAAVLFVLRK